MYLCELFLNSKLKWSVWVQIPSLLPVFLSIPLNEYPYDNQLFFIFEEIKLLLFNRMKTFMTFTLKVSVSYYQKKESASSIQSFQSSNLWWKKAPKISIRSINIFNFKHQYLIFF